MQQNQNFNEDPNSSFDRILCQIDTNQLAAALQSTMQPHHNSQHAFASNSQYGTEHHSGTNYHQPTSHGDTQNLHSVSAATMNQCKLSQDLKSLDSKADSASFLNQSRPDVLGNSSNYVQRFDSHPFEQENTGANSLTDLTCSISKSTNLSSGEKRAYYQPKMPHVGEFELEDGFIELWYKKESFNIVPDNKDLPVLFENILCIPSSMRGELTPVLSFSIETFTRLDNTSMCSRVVLLNEKGERVLDTLVKVDDSIHQNNNFIRICYYSQFE